MSTQTEGPWTVLKILKWTTNYFEEKGIESGRLEAELLLSHVLDCDRVKLYMQFDQPLSPDELAEFRSVIKRRANHEPVAYITGSRAFWTIELACDSRVLIPRPETECVLEVALEKFVKESEPNVIDIGTGTGALGIAFATERPKATVTLSDVSAEALSVARKNIETYELSDRIQVVEGDLFAGVPDSASFDLILSNPPYVATNEKPLMDANVLQHEPHLALFSGPDGLDIIRRLIPESLEILEAGGWLVMEHGFAQGPAIRQLLIDAGFTDVEIRKDYSGHDRVALGRKP